MIAKVMMRMKMIRLETVKRFKRPSQNEWVQAGGEDIGLGISEDIGI